MDSAPQENKPRAGWAEQLRQMAEAGDDRLIDEPTPTTWDQEEWEWPEEADDAADLRAIAERQNETPVPLEVVEKQLRDEGRL